MRLNTLMPNINTLIPYDYESLQNPEYENLINRCLAKARYSSSPRFVQVGGIPGSGKSTLCTVRGWTNELFVSFDAIMEQLSGYVKDIGKIGKVESFKKWEIPARVIGYELLRRAVAAKADIFLEHSGVNRSHVQLVDSLKELGYRIEMHFILCRIDVACSRARAREQATSRHTPVSLIEERCKQVDTYLAIYAQKVNNLFVYDSTDNLFSLCQNYQRGILVQAA